PWLTPSHHRFTPETGIFARRLMMNKSLRGEGEESSRNAKYGFRDGEEDGQKKSRRANRRLLKLITGRRQTEWTGATRCPNEDADSHIRESLTDRKRANLLRLYLPCRPLADWLLPSPLVGEALGGLSAAVLKNADASHRLCRAAKRGERLS